MNIYDFDFKDINGVQFDWSTLRGKRLLIVNTASECGLTPQFEQLEELYQSFKDSNFSIIGFPSNDFGAQDPGSNQEIQTFCQVNYGVSFPMMAKIKVKGEDQHPLYSWLTSHKDEEVSWNFQKFLIDENGDFVASISPQTLPIDQEIIDWIRF